jgi:hypothetical protein
MEATEQAIQGLGSKFYFTLPVAWEMNRPARRAR